MGTLKKVGCHTYKSEKNQASIPKISGWILQRKFCRVPFKSLLRVQIKQANNCHSSVNFVFFEFLTGLQNKNCQSEARNTNLLKKPKTLKYYTQYTLGVHPSETTFMTIFHWYITLYYYCSTAKQCRANSFPKSRIPFGNCCVKQKVFLESIW